MSAPLPAEILALPIPDRIALVEKIWDSIAEDETQFTLTEAQRAELDRRLAQPHDVNLPGSSWPEVKKRIQGDA